MQIVPRFYCHQIILIEEAKPDSTGGRKVRRRRYENPAGVTAIHHVNETYHKTLYYYFKCKIPFVAREPTRFRFCSGFVECMQRMLNHS